ncbi:MAG: hypothetical protein WBL35_14400 [Ornithinibacter sp.]
MSFQELSVDQRAEGMEETTGERAEGVTMSTVVRPRTVAELVGDAEAADSPVH